MGAASQTLRACVLALSGFLASPVAAGVSQGDLIAAGMPSDLAPFAASVSSSEGNWDSVNWADCAGAFQFCPATRQRYYSGSLASFLASPSAQVTAYRSYMANEWGNATRNGFDALIGSQVCYNGSCATISASSIIKACQFGCGYGGKLGHYFRNGDCDADGAKDGNDYSVCNYLISGAGYDVSDVTEMEEDGLVVAGGVGTCFGRELMSAAGLVVTSPFGVDRTGRASNGYHLGLDLANSAGMGDLIYAGLDGKVVFSAANSTNSVFIETPDGNQRVGYLHGRARRVAVGDEVFSDTAVIAQGDTGSPGAVHLHLEVHVSGEVMAEVGEAAGRTWPLSSRSSFFGNKGSSGLSGASLEGAAPAAFYVVNPEPYLFSRLPFTDSVLNATQYADQGFSRPDGLTLEQTCAPSAVGGLVSSNGGANAMGGVAASGAALAGNTQTLANMATGAGRDAVIQYGQASIGSARTGAIRSSTDRGRISVLAGLILATEEDR